MEIEHMPARVETIDRRKLIYLALFALALILLVPHLVRTDHLVQLLRTAKPEFIAIAALAETLRYFFSAGSTLALARLFHKRVPLVPMTEAFFAGAALNRTFSTGGAPGMIVRLVFLVKQDVHAGSVAAIFLIEDIIGLVIGAVVFAFGASTLANSLSPAGMMRLAISFTAGTIVVGGIALWILRKRTIVARWVHWLAQQANRFTLKFLRRAIYVPERVQQGLNDFYVGMHAARVRPQYTAISFLFNLLRYVAGCATLYFSFHALGDTIAPGVLILLYTAASVLSTTSALPGEVAIMGTGFIVLFGSLGLSPEAAILALVLSRALAFWLPMPVGFLALLHLRRKHGI